MPNSPLVYQKTSKLPNVVSINDIYYIITLLWSASIASLCTKFLKCQFPQDNWHPAELWQNIAMVPKVLKKKDKLVSCIAKQQKTK